MPRLSLTPDEEAHLRPMLEAYRQRKEVIAAFNAGLGAALQAAQDCPEGESLLHHLQRAVLSLTKEP